MRPRTTIASLLWNFARVARLVLGTFWAAGLLFIGLGCWRWSDALVDGLSRYTAAHDADAARIVSLAMVGAIAGGEFVFVRLVANDLCPRRPAALSGFVEITTGLLVVFCIASLAWFGWSAIP